MGLNYGKSENACFFKSIVHKQSGQKIMGPEIVEGVYIENMDLSGPKLVIKVKDYGSFLSRDLKLKEYDEFTVAMNDGNASIRGDWTLLKYMGIEGGMGKLFLMSKDLYKMKEIAKTTTVFHRRGLADILSLIAQGLKPILGLFGITNDYHVYAGERPTETLRQIEQEQGAHIWTCRGKFNMKRAAEIFAQSPVMEFEYKGKGSCEHPVTDYKKASNQIETQDSSARSFRGWDETKGRIKTSPSVPFMKGLGRRAPTQTSASNSYTLNNAPISIEKAVDFYTPGDLRIEAGKTVKVRWNTGDPANPINTGLPAKMIATCVCHWYRMGGEFWTRVEGSKIATGMK